VTPVATTAERIRQEAFHVEATRKRELLAELLKRPEVKRTIVFTRTKRGADKVTEYLGSVGLSAVAIHGNKSQGQRERALETFRAGRTPVLVATDIAARGIDVDGVTHVVNYELPDVAESYVHRIGRTARAGADGAAFTLCDDAERHLLRAIEKLTRQSIPATDRRQPGARPLSEPPRAAAPGGRNGKPQGRPGAGKPAHTGPRPGQAKAPAREGQFARNGASRPRPAREAGGFSR
jgi:ATP-dependent RNA helicase RhlE